MWRTAGTFLKSKRGVLAVLFIAILMLTVVFWMIFSFSSKTRHLELTVFKDYWTERAQMVADNIAEALIDEIKKKVNIPSSDATSWFGMFRDTNLSRSYDITDFAEEYFDKVKFTGLDLESATITFYGNVTKRNKGAGSLYEREQVGKFDVEVVLSYRGKVTVRSVRRASYRTIRVRHPVLSDYLLVVRNAKAEYYASNPPKGVSAESQKIWKDLSSFPQTPYSFSFGNINFVSYGALARVAFYTKGGAGLPDRIYFPLGAEHVVLMENADGLVNEVVKGAIGGKISSKAFPNYSQLPGIGRRFYSKSVEFRGGEDWLEPLEYLMSVVWDGAQKGYLNVDTGGLKKLFDPANGRVKKYRDKIKLAITLSYLLEGKKVVVPTYDFNNPAPNIATLYYPFPNGQKNELGELAHSGIPWTAILNKSNRPTNNSKARLVELVYSRDRDFKMNNSTGCFEGKFVMVNGGGGSGQPFSYAPGGINFFPWQNDKMMATYIEGDVWFTYQLVSKVKANITEPTSSSLPPNAYPTMWFAERDKSGSWNFDYNDDVNKYLRELVIKGSQLLGGATKASLRRIMSQNNVAMGSGLIAEPAGVILQRYNQVFGTNYKTSVINDPPFSDGSPFNFTPFPYWDEVSRVWLNFNDFKKKNLDSSGRLWIFGVNFIKSGDIDLRDVKEYAGIGAIITTNDILLKKLNKAKNGSDLLYPNTYLVLLTYGGQIKFYGDEPGFEGMLVALNMGMNNANTSTDMSRYSCMVGPYDADNKMTNTTIKGTAVVDILNAPSFRGTLTFVLSPEDVATLDANKLLENGQDYAVTVGDVKVERYTVK